MMDPENESAKTVRLASLDALRGFDMLFIMGGEGLVCALAAALGFPGFKESFGHAAWHGLHFMDLVFPLFLFMAGVSFPFSCAKSLGRGMSRKRVALKSLKRGAMLVFLGLCCSRLLSFDFEHLRVWSVLGRIGVAWKPNANLNVFPTGSLRATFTVTVNASPVFSSMYVFFGLDVQSARVS